MARTTIDFGIDLGTTNSVVAVANDGKIEIIKNNGHQITPSMVYIDKRGKVYRGHPASHHLNNARKSGDVQIEFKREMGQKVHRHFEAAGQTLSPEELSAEILAELRRAAGERFGQPPEAAVITVPAMFELPQNDATARAAQRAGFGASVLLQEPVAAATAYGFEHDADKAHWLVYDLGGGTFDASIISIRENQLSVTRHAGDNYLGGSDFDRAIVDRIIVPMLRDRYDLENLVRGRCAADPTTRGRYAKIKVIAEELKKNLSREEEDTVFYEEVFEDDSGDPVDVEIDLSRADFEQLIHPNVQKSLDITAQLIQDAGLKPTDIEKTLLVGGSTFVPMVQRQVASLGIAVDRTLDPMTVVAHGAAVFASGQRLPRSMVGGGPVRVGTARVDLEYEPIGKELSPTIGGKLTIDGAAPPAGTTVTIARTTDQGWTSGDLPLDGKGMFFTEVLLRDAGQSVFRIAARDRDGNAVACQPDAFTMTYGLSVAKATLPQAISMGLADGKAHLLLAQGVSLPNRSEVHKFKTTKPLLHGTDDSLHIPILTGDKPESELNRVGICWKLTGHEVERDLPQGTEVELAVEVDASGTTAASITIPLLDEHFYVRHASDLEHEPAPAMRQRLDSLRNRLQRLTDETGGQPASQIAGELGQLRDSAAWDEIENRIAAWADGDHVAAGQARNLLVDLSERTKTLEGKAHWPAKLAELEALQSDARRTVHDMGGASERQALDHLVSEAERAVADRDPRMLDRALESLRHLNYGLLREDPRFLAAMLRHLAQQEARFLDRRRGRELLAEGAMALKRQDAESLDSIVGELFRLLPPELSSEIRGLAVRSDINIV